MGRRKIEIQPITNERNRSVTFLKRKNGLFKKAYELGVLCNVDVAVIVFEDRPGHPTKLYEYCSGDIREIAQREARHDGEKDARGPSDFSNSSSTYAPNPQRGRYAEDDDDDGDNDAAEDAEGDDDDEVPHGTRGARGTKRRLDATSSAAGTPGMQMNYGASARQAYLLQPPHPSHMHHPGQPVNLGPPPGEWGANPANRAMQLPGLAPSGQPYPPLGGLPGSGMGSGAYVGAGSIPGFAGIPTSSSRSSSSAGAASPTSAKRPRTLPPGTGEYGDLFALLGQHQQAHAGGGAGTREGQPGSGGLEWPVAASTSTPSAQFPQVQQTGSSTGNGTENPLSILSSTSADANAGAGPNANTNNNGTDWLDLLSKTSNAASQQNNSGAAESWERGAAGNGGGGGRRTSRLRGGNRRGEERAPDGTTGGLIDPTLSSPGAGDSGGPDGKKEG